VFINIDKSLVIGLFVDNIIIAAKTLDAVEEFKKDFGSIHKIKDLGEIYRYLRLTIT
jgi:Reverse transcriptase (RNA-dependent DNA polymerase)